MAGATRPMGVQTSDQRSLHPVRHHGRRGRAPQGTTTMSATGQQPPTTPANAPRVLVDLASLERTPLATRARASGPYSLRSVVPPRFAGMAPRPATPVLGEPERAAILTIGRLAREGRIALCTYGEFDPAGPPDGWRGTWRELLGDVPVAVIESALAGDALGEDVFRDGPQSGALARLCARLKQCETTATAPDPAAPAPADGPRSLDRFHKLAARVQGARLADLYHLWSAECAGCPWWLTLDAEIEDFLRDWVAPGLREPLACEPVTPNALLTRLGIAERDAPTGAEHRVVMLRPGVPRG
jgi:hypothetical protein